MMSSVSEEDVMAEEGAPGAARVDGLDEAESIGRRALRRDMLRALVGRSVSMHGQPGGNRQDVRTVAQWTA